MALITCPECGKQVSDRAAACVGCGAPILAQKEATKEYSYEDALAHLREQPSPKGPVKCPSCGSTEFSANKKGFSGVKALAGGVVLGPVGLLGGLHGAGVVKVTCLKCGHVWRAGQ